MDSPLTAVLNGRYGLVCFATERVTTDENVPRSLIA
jgi:hypothetical protein